MAADRIVIFDTTLRDGEQAPGFSLRVSEKLQLARQLDALGVDIIEAGFPIASEADAEAVRVIAAEVPRPVTAALARCRRDDIERAGDSLKGAARTRIHTFIATSDLHLEKKLHISRADCLQAATDAVTQARGYTDNVQFSAEDATRSDLDFLCRVVESVIKAGATTVNLPDTLGYSTPTRSTSSSTPSSPASPTPTRPSSARTATTTSGWQSPTRWRRCAPVRGRWSARSTASASGQATPRSKKS